MKLVASNLNDQAYHSLKNSIINKEIPPGTRLVDTQLAEQFGISRTPIRDAVRKLAEDGLVVKQKNSYTVFCPSEKDIRDIFDLRLIFDLAAAKKLIYDVLPGNGEAMEQIRQSFEQIIMQEAAPEEPHFVLNDESFHQTLIRLTGNSRMLELYSELSTQTRAFRRITSNDPDRVRRATEYHEKIFEGFMALDFTATTDAIRNHVDFSLKDALKDFSASD